MTEGLHRKLVEESSDVVTVIDPDGRITYVSPAVRNTLGYEPDDLVGEVGYEYQHPDDRETVASAIERLHANPDETQTIETRFRRADGSWCWIEATLQNRLDDEDVCGILVNSRDVSERKTREGQFRRLAEEYGTLLDTVDDGIFFLDVGPGGPGSEYAFRFERLNRAYEEQTGLTTEEVQGRTPTEVFGDELGVELRANYHRCARGQTPVSYQEELPVETGARFWQTNLAPVLVDGEVTRIIGITRNVTEQVRRERRLRSQKERLDEFASVVSHDLRNPLEVAQGRAELLAEECTSAHLPPILRSLDRMDELVSDTLTLARQGRVIADPEPVDLGGLVDECWRTVETGEATLEVDDGGEVVGDRSQLRHVFENLLRNAVEHGGRDVTVRVTRPDDRRLRVEDTGPGIPEHARADAFEPGHTSTTDGTGFGLTIVRRVAEAHGWTVEIAESPEGGARFEFGGVEADRS